MLVYSNKFCIRETQNLNSIVPLIHLLEISQFSISFTKLRAWGQTTARTVAQPFQHTPLDPARRASMSLSLSLSPGFVWVLLSRNLHLHYFRFSQLRRGRQIINKIIYRRPQQACDHLPLRFSSNLHRDHAVPVCVLSVQLQDDSD